MNGQRNEYFEKALRTPTKKKPAPFVFPPKEKVLGTFWPRFWFYMKVLVFISLILSSVILAFYYYPIDNLFLYPPHRGDYLNFRTSIECWPGYDILDGFCVPSHNETIKMSYQVGIFLAGNLHEPSFRKHCLGENIVITKTEKELHQIISSGGIGSLVDDQNNEGNQIQILTPEKLDEGLELQKCFGILLKLWKVEKRWEIEFTNKGEERMIHSTRYGKSKFQCLRTFQNIKDLVFNSFLLNILTKPFDYFKS